MPSLQPEVDHDDSCRHLQWITPPDNFTPAFSGTLSLGGMTPSRMDNGTILSMHSAVRSLAPVSPFLENTFNRGISFSVPSSLPSPVRAESVGNQSNLTEFALSHGQLNFEFQNTPNFHPHSLPEYHDGLANSLSSNSLGMAANTSAGPLERIENRKFCIVSSNGMNDSVFGPSGNGIVPSPRYHHMWISAHRPQQTGMMWSNPPFVSGACTAHPPPQLHPLPKAPSHMLNTLMPINNHHVGSAPSVNPSLWNKLHGYAVESPDASCFQPGSLGNIRISGSSLQPLELISHDIFPCIGGSCIYQPMSSKNIGLHFHHQRCPLLPGRGQVIPVMNSCDSLNEWTRSNQADNKKQFELDIDRIVRGEDSRTTLMIKNIPNKYTSKMLLAAIDECHQGTYDFIYLPIDFKNKCNFGYAFFNMTDPSLIIPFYKAFNGKKWEKFNSENVASLAYARIQGKTALVAHFQNSSLMNEVKRCRPILFHTAGPNAGDQVPFPLGVSVRSRPWQEQSQYMRGKPSRNHDNSDQWGGIFLWRYIFRLRKDSDRMSHFLFV